MYVCFWFGRAKQWLYHVSKVQTEETWTRCGQCALFRTEGIVVLRIPPSDFDMNLILRYDTVRPVRRPITFMSPLFRRVCNRAQKMKSPVRVPSSLYVLRRDVSLHIDAFLTNVSSVWLTFTYCLYILCTA